MKGIISHAKTLFLAFVIAVVQIWKDFSNDNGSQAAASFAFFSFLSLLSLIILAGAVLGTVLKGNQQLLNEIMEYITTNVPGITNTVKQALDASINLRGVLGIGGILGLLYTGTKVFDSFQVWLNSIWGVKRPDYLKKKAKSLLTLLFTGGVVLLGFGLHIALFLLRKNFYLVSTLMPVLVFIVTALVLFVGLLFIYSYSVEIRMGWRRVWKGALFAALLLNPVQMVLSWYYTKIGDIPAIYGSFGGVVLTIIAIYYAGYIIYLGAELNRYLDTQMPRPSRA
ncbi:MAG: YihY/virulence factor BrkB family protein [Actinobacteria bacterium]|jgi:membrane protein|nr:MAG: YihY/virulence factor BrkB family protein [Actinomycetota bacterium]